MPLPLFYHSHECKTGNTLVLEDETAKHLLVLRMQADEKIQLTDGKGLLATVRLTAISKKSCEAEVLEQEQKKLPEHRLHLAIAFTKNAGRNEWLLEKAAELGVGSIIPLQTQRTERLHFKEERWRNILISAMLQSQQYFLPVIETPKPFAGVIESFKNISQKLIAHCDPYYERLPLKNAMKPFKDTIILIGPEGDFTKEEIEMAINANFTTVDLGTNRLRTETAGMAVCAYFKMING